MNVAAGHALEQALAYYRAPALLSVARERRLPDDVLDLLRIAAGDSGLVEQSSTASGMEAGMVTEAAVFFVQQVLFAEGADNYRVLGVNADAPDSRIKEHYRWLVRWLHPDRNTDDWDSVYAERVNSAWQMLRLPDRRREYDQARVEPWPGEGKAVPIPARRATDPFRIPPPVGEPALLSAHVVKQLPTLVLGGLGGLAISVLLLMWWTAGQDRQIAPREARMETEAAALRELPGEAPPAPSATESGTPPVAEMAPAPVSVATQAPAPLPAPVVPGASGALAARPAPASAAPSAGQPAAESRPPASGRQPAASPRESRTLAAAPVQAPAAGTSRAAIETPVATASERPPVPDSSAAAAPSPTSVPLESASYDESAARAVMGQFSSAYSAGDINALMRLFTRDARNNRGGRDAIVYDYQSLFSSTQSRALRFTPTGYISLGDGSATLLARYEATVKQADKRKPESSRGQIRFDLRMEDGALKISQVRHDNE